LTEQAVDSAIRGNNRENGSLSRAIEVQREAAYGNLVEARHWATEAFALAPANRSVQSETALALVLAGDTARSESLA
jgi:hypothetical protein